MVAGFQLNNEDGDGGNGADGKHPTRKKYLVARSKEQTNSIFDYVHVLGMIIAPLLHLSTTLLQKVRFSQPIELAIQKPLKGAKGSASKKQQLTNLEDYQSSRLVATKSSSKSTSRSKASSSSSQPARSSSPLIRYGHVVRFQAADSGFLLVESDGCLRKVPKDHASDPRTLITLFPRDPLANVGKQHNRRVYSGDWAFIVQGSAAALESELGIARADSDEMVEGPAYLANEATRHDELAATAVALVHDQHQRHDHDQTQWRQHSHVSKQEIRMKQLAQAFPQETESMPTTVWCLQRVSRSPGVISSHSPNPHGDKPFQATLKWDKERGDSRSSCFKHGTQLQIFQNNFVVCYELQSSKDDDEDGNNNRRSRRRSSAMSSFPLGAAAVAAVADEKAPLSGTNTNSVESRASPSEALLSEGQTSGALGHSNENASIFTHVWLQETQEFGVSSHPTDCLCSTATTSNSSCNSDRRRAVWDNTWMICDINVVERRNSRDPPLSLGSPQQEKARRRSKPSATATTKVEPLVSAESNKSEEPKAPGGEDDELDPLSEEQEEDEEDEVGEEEQETPLQRQASVFYVAKFAVKAETQQARAARIIVRFFQRVFRDEVTQSRVQDFLRRRRRLTLTKRNGETKLSTKQQLKLLQCYNPNVYGVGGGGGPGSTRWQNQQRGVLTFDKFTNSAEADRQKLATMKCEVDFLNRDWLRTERHSVQKMTSISHEMYSHRPLSSPFTSKRILANREREQQFHVEMKMARRDPPSFHYGSFQAATATRRPRTAPLAIEPFGEKSS